MKLLRELLFTILRVADIDSSWISKVTAPNVFLGKVVQLLTKSKKTLISLIRRHVCEKSQFIF